MKLSDVRGERVFDVIADLIGPVTDLLQKDSVKAMLTGDRKNALKALPDVIRENKSDIVLILSIIEGVTPEEYLESMTAQSLINDVMELLNDEGFTDFLASSK